MNCKCKEWIENIGKIDGAFEFKANHGCGDYNGKKFKYCPWCGKELEDDLMTKGKI
jgi:hypothetical protein